MFQNGNVRLQSLKGQSLRELRMLKRYLIAETSAFRTEKATFLGRNASFSFSAELVPIHSPNFVLKFGPMRGNISPFRLFGKLALIHPQILNSAYSEICGRNFYTVLFRENRCCKEVEISAGKLKSGRKK